ncbi:uncharacterized protein TNIN_270571 [Trichonephila inaurata madagascariensis]|uniref:Uncharacterized protein n=1 Tax=Trichonephila inaurata madagascariensis TaxID=2747483 RepID=A0A8X6Y0T0_9ARAC|nr:uncharacterized protein TNIN_270571 [Trichonephila inaurata madagascariensis]
MIEGMFISEKLKKVFLVLYDINAIINTTLLTLNSVSLSAFYGLACFYITDLCRHTEKAVANAKEIRECKAVIYQRLKIRNLMQSLENFMCFPAFTLVVSSMTGMFWSSYKVIFVTNKTNNSYLHYLSCTAAEMFHCSIIGMLILSASSANTAAEVAKEAVLSFPGKIPQYYNELKVILRKDSKKNICLTLWKVYKIDRSLIISAVATLGTVNSHNNK